MPRPLNKIIQDNYPGLDGLADFLTKTYDLLVELHTWAETLATKINADSGDTGGDNDYDATITGPNPSDPDAAT